MAHKWEKRPHKWEIGRAKKGCFEGKMKEILGRKSAFSSLKEKMGDFLVECEASDQDLFGSICLVAF